MARPAGTADAVDVGLGHLGQVVIKDVGELLDVNAPSGNIGGHQALYTSTLKIGQSLLPGGLGLVPMDGGGGNARLVEVPRHLVGAMLGAGKDQGVLHPQRLHQVGQELGLVGLIHKAHLLVNDLHRRGHRVHLYLSRVVEQRVHQLHDLGRHGGRKEEGLLLLRQELQYPTDVVDKAHVQHAVCLVQYKDLHSAQVQQSLALEVQQTSRCGHQDVHTLLQLIHLGLLPHTAKDNGGAQRQIAAIGGKGLLDLEGQLPGGCEDQGADIPGAHHHVGVEPLENGGGEGTGFTRAGLGAAQHIPPL